MCVLDLVQHSCTSVSVSTKGSIQLLHVDKQTQTRTARASLAVVTVFPCNFGAQVRLDDALAALIAGNQSEKAKNFVFVKGADSVVPPLCQGVTDVGRERLEDAHVHIDDFARDCLRTLCLACK